MHPTVPVTKVAPPGKGKTQDLAPLTDGTAATPAHKSVCFLVCFGMIQSAETCE